ncbi:8432_t:CDS:2, partial [Funneliformis caledonium]
HETAAYIKNIPYNFQLVYRTCSPANLDLSFVRDITVHTASKCYGQRLKQNSNPVIGFVLCVSMCLYIVSPNVKLKSGALLEYDSDSSRSLLTFL